MGAVDESSDSSAETRESIDDEVRRIVGEQSARADALLPGHRDALKQLAIDLSQPESLDGSVVRAALTSVGQAGAATAVDFKSFPRWFARPGAVDRDRLLPQRAVGDCTQTTVCILVPIGSSRSEWLPKTSPRAVSRQVAERRS
jgi:hypothetical protein